MLQQSPFLDPFSIDGILNLPSLDLNPYQTWDSFHFDDRLHSDSFQLAEAKHDDLPSLSVQRFTLDLSEVPLPDLSSSICSQSSSENTELRNLVIGDNEEEPEDIWSLDVILEKCQSFCITTWDHFLGENHAEPPSAYLSEAGPATFNAVLESISEDKIDLPLKITHPDVFLSSLFDLALGRSSSLFQLVESETAGFPNHEKIPVLGYTPNTTSLVVESFRRTGLILRKLTEFTANKDSPGAITSTNVAFSASVLAVLTAVQARLESGRSGLASLLQLQDLFRRPMILLEILSDLFERVQENTEHSDIVPRLMNQIQHHVSRHPWTEDVLGELLVRTTTPFLEDLQHSVGLGVQEYSGESLSFSKVPLLRGDASSPLYLGAVLPLELCRTIEESVHSLRLLRDLSSEHALLHAWKLKPLGPQRVIIKFAWDDLGPLDLRAREYEEDMKAVILSSRQVFEIGRNILGCEDFDNLPLTASFPFNFDTELSTSVELESCFNSSFPSIGLIQADFLPEIVDNGLDLSQRQDLKLRPLIKDAIALSVTPILLAQHRLLSFSAIEVLFQGSQIRRHLNLQYQFQTFGNVEFTSRLSQALFDSDQSSGEGRRKDGRSTGLRMRTRDTWPPASSELRLVLMRILSDSMNSDKQEKLNTEVSESVSFAIRELSDEDLEKCRDANSIYALDFLQIHYKPPNALLEAIITAKSVRKYDRIFKHLLRLLRVRELAQSLLRDVTSKLANLNVNVMDRRFRVGVQQFISTLANYTHDIAIGIPWQKLESAFSRVEQCLERKDYEATLHLACSLDHLRELHEGTVDEMTAALFLNKSSEETLLLLESIFGVVLEFAAKIRRNQADDDTIKHLYHEFKELVAKFVRLLKDQTLTSQSVNASSMDFGAPEHLLVRLDLNGYWSR